MKTSRITFFAAVAGLALLAIFWACDKVKHPNQHPDVYVDCVQKAPIVMTNTASNNFRKVLVEDYTGHTCGNCPRAAEAAESIVATYQESVVIVANHVTKDFAAPKTDSTWREDFRDPVATEWDDFFKQSGNGLPKGMVDRLMPYPQNYSNWSALVASELAKPQVAKIDLTTSYDPVQKTLNVKAKTTFKKTMTDSVYLSVVLTVDSIRGDQTDYTPPPGVPVDPNRPTRRLNYLFNGIFAGSLNGTEGDMVKLAPNNNDTVTIYKNCNVVSKCFYKDVVCLNDKNVNVVAFLYNYATKQVLQVEKLRIR